MVKKKRSDFLSLDKSAVEKTTKVRKKSSDDGSSGKEFFPYSQSRGIVYLSHLPHGFYEKELRAFLAQFGAVTNLRVGRSRKTGRSKGYAFVEFRYPEVANIVAETMNNYLMFDKLVKCETLPPEKISRRCFRNKVDPNMPPLKKSRMESKRQVNQLRTEEQNNQRLRTQLKRLQALKRKLESAGVPSSLEGSGGVALPSGKTPVMEVDEDDLDIKMKTPPNVRKIKSAASSRANSAANSAAATPKLGKKALLAAAAATAHKAPPSMAEQVAKRLLAKGGAKRRATIGGEGASPAATKAKSSLATPVNGASAGKNKKAKSRRSALPVV